MLGKLHRNIARAAAHRGKKSTNFAVQAFFAPERARQLISPFG
jgi:uncharacterized protein (DUF1778 family)